MQYPIEVILQRMPSTPEAEASVFEAVGSLERFCDRIVGCQVFIRGPEASDEGVYTISLKVRTPDCEITIAGQRWQDPAHRDLKAALHDAFAQAERELSALSLPLCTCSGARAHAAAH